MALGELRSRYGDDHAVVGAALHNLGVAYGLCGDANEERAHLEKALEIQAARLSQAFRRLYRSIYSNYYRTSLI